MSRKDTKKGWTLTVSIIVIITLGITSACSNAVDSDKIIGEKDTPTDIWIGEDVE